MKNRKWTRVLLALCLALGFLMTQAPEVLPRLSFSVSQAQADGARLVARKKKNKTQATATPVPTAAEEAEGPTATPLPEGPIIDPQSIADYLFVNGVLPDNFITKQEAQRLGWDSSCNYISDVAPGKSLGGSHFGNYEQLLPVAPGRKYYECDCFYEGGKRNAYRVIYSNDGLVFYTADHYTTFVQLHPTVENLANGVTNPLDPDGTLGWTDPRLEQKRRYW